MCENSRIKVCENAQRREALAPPPPDRCQRLVKLPVGMLVAAGYGLHQILVSTVRVVPPATRIYRDAAL